jgi:hypothetical protein
MDEGFTHLYEPEYLKLLRANKSSASLGPLDPYLYRLRKQKEKEIS